MASNSKYTLPATCRSAVYEEFTASGLHNLRYMTFIPLNGQGEGSVLQNTLQFLNGKYSAHCTGVPEQLEEEMKKSSDNLNPEDAKTFFANFERIQEQGGRKPVDEISLMRINKIAEIARVYTQPPEACDIALGQNVRIKNKLTVILKL